MEEEGLGLEGDSYMSNGGGEDETESELLRGMVQNMIKNIKETLRLFRPPLS